MNLLNKIVLRLTLLAAALLVSFWCLAAPGQAQIGFQAKFPELPNVVSKYDSTDYRFSVAIYPKTLPIFMRMPVYQPVCDRNASDSGYIVFDTKYRSIDSLIPMAVDARKFLAYRIAKDEKMAWQPLHQIAPGSTPGEQAVGHQLRY